MPNSIAFAQNYTGILDEVYQRASVSGCLNSGRRLIRADRDYGSLLVGTASASGIHSQKVRLRNKAQPCGNDYLYRCLAFLHTEGERALIL